MITTKHHDGQCDPFAEELTGQAATYAHGDCHILASVLSSLTGLPIHAGLTEDIWTQRTCLVHAWVAMPDGRALDAHGLTNPKNLLQQYPDGDRAEICVLTSDHVMRLGSGRKVMSQKNRKKAEDFAAKLLADYCLDMLQK